jgi:hypothetical protein
VLERRNRAIRAIEDTFREYPPTKASATDEDIKLEAEKLKSGRYNCTSNGSRRAALSPVKRHECLVQRMADDANTLYKKNSAQKLERK